MRRPRCLCAGAESLLSLGQALDDQLCEQTGGLDAAPQSQQDCYQVHQTPVLGEELAAETNGTTIHVAFTFSVCVCVGGGANA